MDWLKQSCHTSIQLLQGMCSIYAQRPMFGFCEPSSDQWQTISYRQAWERVLHFAAGAWPALSELPRAALPAQALTPPRSFALSTQQALGHDCEGSRLLAFCKWDA